MPDSIRSTDNNNNNMTTTASPINMKRVRAFLSSSFSDSNNDNEDSEVVDLYTKKQVDEATLPHQIGEVVFEASFDAEREEKLEILRAVSCAVFCAEATMGDNHYTMKNIRNMFHWCSFCNNASSAKGPAGFDNTCAICKQDIPCRAWCGSDHWKHVTECSERVMGGDSNNKKARK